MSLDVSTPVLLLGGKENSLSIARHLGRLGITVRAAGAPSCWALYSRFCKQAYKLPNGEKQQDFWYRLLLGNDCALDGHIVLALSDDAIEFISRNRAELQSRYLLDEAAPALQQAFLDKKRTLEMARAAGVGFPAFAGLKSEKDIAAAVKELRFPVAVKPIQSHKFSAVFGKKLFVIESSATELAEKVRLAWSHGIEVFAVEMIPGADSQLSSYYTYRTSEGRSLFHFTKAIIRRWPVNRGNACYHRTGEFPETAEAGARFFEAVGLQGLGNIEFKRDARDGELKIIEVNARFTAAQELLRRAGYPVDLMVYCHLTRQPVPSAKPVSRELRFWYPLRDFLGFMELRKRGELSAWGWLKSIASTSHVFPLASLTDPAPMIGAGLAVALRLVA